jgi:NADPH-dependent ferric siderophore reductase
MAETGTLVAATRVTLPDPQAMLEKLCEHFVEHGTVTRTAFGGRIDSPLGTAVLDVEGNSLSVKAECPNEGALFIVKSSIAEHIFMFAEDETLDLSWTGDRANARDIPYFRQVVVRSARNITPKMRRVTVACSDTRHYETGGMHVGVLIPSRDREPVWPYLGADGRAVWPKGEDEITRRIYTIRRIDHKRGELDIDVVLHGDTPGSVWATEARPGDRVGLMGPGGGNIPEVRSYLLVGCETALPVIARIAAELPAHARATIILEIADASEEQPIFSAATLDLLWLHRNGAEAGSTDSLLAAVRDVRWADHAPDFVLVGCEQTAARAIRKYLRKERGLNKEQHLVAAYWRRGHAGTPEDRD